MCQKCDAYVREFRGLVECGNVPRCGWRGWIEVKPGQHNTCPECGHHVRDERQCEGCFEFPCVCGTYVNDFCQDAAFPDMKAYNAVEDAK